MTLYDHALASIEAGIDAAHPHTVIDETLDFDGTHLTVNHDSYALESFDEVLVVGGGKAAGAVAEALERKLGVEIDGGTVVTTAPGETERVHQVEGTHPLPSLRNVEGTRQILDRTASTGEDDLVVAVVTGGASALLCAPVDGVSLEEYRTLTEQLLHSGATIDELNAVRKHLSRIKGGRLAAVLAPATVVAVVFSDVVGNPLDVIASGPTAPDATTYEDARHVIERYGVDVPESVQQVLGEGVRGERAETPGEESEVFENVSNHVLADNRTALEAAASVCEELGYTTAILSSRIEGEARTVGGVHAAIVLECLDTGNPYEPPVALLSGGETTVTVTGHGVGGPNQEFALAGALELAQEGDETGGKVALASVDTDGIDGPTDAAGAIVDSETVGPDDVESARVALDGNDAYTYLDVRDALVRTGSTGTNVNDLRVTIIPDS